MFQEVETLVNSIWVTETPHFDILDYQPKNEVDNLTQLLDIVLTFYILKVCHKSK